MNFAVPGFLMPAVPECMKPFREKAANVVKDVKGDIFKGAVKGFVSGGGQAGAIKGAAAEVFKSGKLANSLKKNFFGGKQS